MDLSFGRAVYEKTLKLTEEGKDANQVAKIVCDQDAAGNNYGIGIMLDSNGNPMETSPTLLASTRAELDQSTAGNYMSSAAHMDLLKAAILEWQQIPKSCWDHFTLTLPSDAGTGAVRTAVDILLMTNPALDTLGLETLGWPAYKSIAGVQRLAWKEYFGDAIMTDPGLLPIYQAGPMNTTGLVRSPDVIEARAQAAARRKTPVILDRAYSGFECARLLETHSYADVMRTSYDHQIRPFIEQGVSFALAISPTKSFVTFSLRPAGILLLYSPDTSQTQDMNKTVNIILRARGSGFEHPITRAFVKAMVNDRPSLETEHRLALERVAEAEALWRKLAEGTSLAYQFSDSYSGLFRNPQVKEGAQAHIYNEHLYPVFSADRCRLNVTGIPADEAIAREHVRVFAEQCY